MNAPVKAIRSEIERRMKKLKDDGNGVVSGTADNICYSAYSGLLSFIDALPEETSYDTQKFIPRPCVDIEDVARVQFASHAHVIERKRKAVLDWEQFKKVVGIFYAFGKEKTLFDAPIFPTSTEMIAEWENNELPMLRDKDFRGDAERMAYNAFMDGFAKGLGYKR